LAEDAKMGGEEKVAFPELSAGRTFASAARTLTETHLVMFTMLTGDWSPIHSDELFAAATPIGRRMFHGTFGISLAIAMAAEALRLQEPVLAALGISDWAFKAPLFIGDTVRAEVGIKATRVTSDGKRGIIEREVRLLKADDTIAQQGVAGLMVRL
jgi:acyl dehydratase